MKTSGMTICRHAAGILLAAAGMCAFGAQPTVATNEAAAVSAQERALIDAWHKGYAGATLPVENMTMPIASHPNGRVRALLKAGRALLPATDDNYVRGSNVVIESFAPDGRLDGIFITDNCFYDRATSSGYCDGKVRIEHRGVRIRGVNMVWNLQNRTAKIMSQPEVRFDRFIQGIGDAFK